MHQYISIHEVKTVEVGAPEPRVNDRTGEAYTAQDITIITADGSKVSISLFT